MTPTPAAPSPSLSDLPPGWPQPGTRALPIAQQRPELIMNPAAIADAYFYLHSQDRSCWTHELQLTPYSTNPSY